MYYFPWTKLVGEYGCSPLGVWLPQLPFGVKWVLANVNGRYFPSSTLLNPLDLFNHSVLELGTGTHPKVGFLTLAVNVVRVALRLVNLGYKEPSLLATGR